MTEKEFIKSLIRGFPSRIKALEKVKIKSIRKLPNLDKTIIVEKPMNAQIFCRDNKLLWNMISRLRNRKYHQDMKLETARKIDAAFKRYGV